MHCISTASFSILVNGQHSKTIYHERVIRQDDPVSHHIFIICPEYLSQLIHFASTQPYIGIMLKKDYPNIQFLIFADDCIIFCRTTKQALREIKYILDHYCQVSAKSINYHKSTI